MIIVATDGASARAELDADYTPQFIRVARVVRDRIADGTYPRLSLVPGSRALAAELHVSPKVVLHGLTILVRAGYLRHIESKPHQVIWDGDPLETTSFPRTVLIEGNEVPLRSRQTELRDRYMQRLKLGPYAKAQ